jgi:phosphoserine aminotransferase
MTPRVFNFSPGPAVLPLSVLEQVQRELTSLPGVGVSILELSHRSEPFLAILAEAEANLRKLLGLGDEFAVLFLQGGSRLQFSMIPMNFMGGGRSADYLVTGSWGEKAIAEAEIVGSPRLAYSSKATRFDRLPAASDLDLHPDAAYVYFTSNETIQGVQFQSEPDAGKAPLVCDASSDFLSRPIDVDRYGLIYACAQKNAGPAGVTIVVVRRSMFASIPDGLPGMLDYRNHDKENSLYNTPPTFGIYVFNLVARWLLEEIGGLAAMQKRNAEKAKMLYDLIDESGGYYRGHAQNDCRSRMNVTFGLENEQLEKPFLAEAEELGLAYLAGHRSVGGVRASIYNAMPVEGVERLADFMRKFKK